MPRDPAELEPREQTPVSVPPNPQGVTLDSIEKNIEQHFSKMKMHSFCGWCFLKGFAVGGVTGFAMGFGLGALSAVQPEIGAAIGSLLLLMMVAGVPSMISGWENMTDDEKSYTLGEIGGGLLGGAAGSKMGQKFGAKHAEEVNKAIQAMKEKFADKLAELQKQFKEGMEKAAEAAKKAAQDALAKLAAKWKEHFGHGPPTSRNTPEDFLNEALRQQGLDKAPPGGLKQKWNEPGFEYEVRAHPAEAKYGKKGSIYRVARRASGLDANGQGSGWEYMDKDGAWHPQKTLKPGPKGQPNPSYNEQAAQDTHIQLPDN